MNITAAVLSKIKKPLILNKGLKFVKLKRGQVLVKILYSAICRSQIMEINGERGKDKYLPHLLGHEGSGIVEKIGAGVKKVSPGNKVFLSWIKGKGIDSGGTKLKDKNNKTINAGPITTFSNYSIISENRCFKIPKKFPIKESVIFGCAIPTGAGIVLNEAKPKTQDKVCIIGLGGVGLSALMACKMLKIKNVTVIDIDKKKLSIAKKVGYKKNIIFKNIKDANTKVAYYNKRQLFDYTIESTGKSSSIEFAFSITKKFGGNCFFASHPDYHSLIKIKPFDLISGKNIYGTWGGASDPQKVANKMAEFFLKNKNFLKLYFSKEYSLKNINKAIIEFKNKSLIKPLIINH
jgi:S-(hydroxymethyl)glutathione dehydrogenase/alcohol dehydrogenase|tara:strand:- start:671 stop:1717 length:1047 start_codon:yes stop_codon:yes gene_type:complete